MYRILVIEDDFSMAEAMKRQMELWGNEVLLISDFQNVIPVFTEYEPHMVLIDIMLPFFNGYHWCSEIRKISDVPVVFISSASDNMNIVMAMNMGGDDFVVKPFDLNFLLAKINSLLRRTYDYQGEMNIVSCGDVILDLDNAKLQYQGNVMELSHNDFIILKELMTHKGKNVSQYNHKKTSNQIDRTDKE